MSDIISGLGKVANVIKNVYDGAEGKEVFDLPVDIAASGKITKIMSKFILAPNIVVEQSLQHLDATVFRNIVKTEMMVFTSVVTNAIRVMVEIYGVTPLVAINSVNPKNMREDIDRAIDLVEGMESADFVGDLLKDKFVVPGLEASNTGGVTTTMTEKDSASFVNSYDIQIQMQNDVGEPCVITIPIIIYPKIIFEKAETLIKRRIGKNTTMSLMDEIDDVRAGVQSVMDIILATNLVKDYADRKLTKKSKFADYLENLDATASIKDILHNSNSFSKNFNIYIFSKSLVPVIEKVARGSLYKDKNKNMILDKLMAFSLTIVDNDSEQLEYFLSDVDGMSVINYQMLSKEKDADINKMLKELMMQKAPF